MLPRRSVCNISTEDRLPSWCHFSLVNSEFGNKSIFVLFYARQYNVNNFISVVTARISNQILFVILQLSSYTHRDNSGMFLQSLHWCHSVSPHSFVTDQKQACQQVQRRVDSWALSDTIGYYQTLLGTIKLYWAPFGTLWHNQPL